MNPELLFAISIVAGFVGAMSGMGGGVVLIPALTFFGLPIKEVIAVSIVSVVATSSGSAAAYVRDHITNLKVGMFLEMFTMVGAIVGAKLSLAAGQQFLFIAFGLVLFACWAALLIQPDIEYVATVKQDGFTRWLELEGSYYDYAADCTIEYKARRAHWGAALMFWVGVIAGLLGIGAGALKVLIHDLVMGLPPKVSTTTSNLIIGVTALAGASVYLAAGLIRPALAAPIVVGIVIGALIGTRTLVRLQNRAVRRFFLAILALLATEMIYRGLKGI